MKNLPAVVLERFYDLVSGYHFLPLMLVLLLTIPAFKDTLQVGYFPMHDDLQVMRQLMMDKCFRDGQIPCRWSQDLGYGYGYPLFNFYPPLPYYLGQIIHFLGFSFIDTVKVLVALNFIVSALTMYFLAKEFWGRAGGVMSALFYVYAPYHAVDIYVRGAINEAWAIAFFPAVFWSLYKLISTQKFFYVPISALFIAFLMLSHNLMLMIFAPFAFFWTIIWIIFLKNFKVIPKLILAAVWSVGLASFFTLPVIFEAKFAHVETLVIGYFNYLAHFVSLNQLFISRFWGYGASLFGPIDDMSFQIGYLHWIFSLLSLSVALLLIKKNLYFSFMILLIFMGTTFYTFMSHQRSSFIWSMLPNLQYLQFPWRFLTITIFGSSFLVGAVALLFSQGILQKIRVPVLIMIILGMILFYQPYFKWQDHWPWVTDQVKFSGELWKLQTTAGIFDYLPIWAPFPPANPPDGNAQIIEGQGQVKDIFKNSIKQEYKLALEKDSTFQINTFYFPGWKYFVNNKEVNIDPYQDKELGRPRFFLKRGEHTIVAKFTNTLIRNIGNTLSVVSWSFLMLILIRILFKFFSGKNQ